MLAGGVTCVLLPVRSSFQSNAIRSLGVRSVQAAGQGTPGEGDLVCPLLAAIFIACKRTIARHCLSQSSRKVRSPKPSESQAGSIAWWVRYSALLPQLQLGARWASLRIPAQAFARAAEFLSEALCEQSPAEIQSSHLIGVIVYPLGFTHHAECAFPGVHYTMALGL